MSNVTDYTYDEESAVKADEAASRLDTGAYVGTFISAVRVISDKKGSEGIELTFAAAGGGTARSTLWTRDADGNKLGGPGPNYLNAILFLFGLRGLKGAPGKVEVYDKDAKERVEQDGIVYPELCNKPIGVVFRKELYTDDNGIDRDRLSLEAVFQTETRLMVSEIKDRKSKAEKLDKYLKSLKPKDTRKKRADEPAQPAMGGVAAGDY